MSGEKEKRTSGKSAGSIRQWGATLGAPAGAQASERSDAEAAEQLDIQESERPDAQASDSLEVQESERPGAQMAELSEVRAASSSEVQESERPAVGAAKRPVSRTAKRSEAQKSKRSSIQESGTGLLRKKQTVYLELDVNSWIRHRIADTDEEISDVVNIAIRRLMAGK